MFNLQLVVRIISVMTQEEFTYVASEVRAKTLSRPYSDYSVFYQKELVDFEQTWKKLQATFVIISVGSSLLLCVILFFLIRKLFKPLEKLNQSVADISAGNYEQNLSTKGEDEIAQLAGSINTMADTIQKQISQLEEENKNKQQLKKNEMTMSCE